MPCRLRGSVGEYIKKLPESDRNTNLLRETHFLLRAHEHLRELNERYFPQSGMTQQEVVAATAARVGFRMPKATENAQDSPDPNASQQ